MKSIVNKILQEEVDGTYVTQVSDTDVTVHDYQNWLNNSSQLVLNTVLQGNLFTDMSEVEIEIDILRIKWTADISHKSWGIQYIAPTVVDAEFMIEFILPSSSIRSDPFHKGRKSASPSASLEVMSAAKDGWTFEVSNWPAKFPINPMEATINVESKTVTVYFQ